jgi:TP901 family phage tail tape measure protein
MPRLGTAEVVYKSVGLTQLRSDIKDSESAFKMGATAAAAYAVAIATSIVKIGMPFEQMILNTGAAMRATEAEFKKLEAAARQAGATTEHTATQAAESLLYLGKAGLSAGQAIQALPGMMNFKTAIGSLMSLGQATDVITDSMTAMGLTVKDLAHLTDLFIAASNRSSTDAAKLGESFTKVAGIARLYGTSVEDLTALLAIQASAGLKAELAGTQLKNAFINTSRAAAELGIENKGLIPTLEAVAKAHWDADKIASVYGKIALPSVVAILQKIDGTGPGSLSYFRDELSHASDGMGEAAVQAEKMRSSVENQFKIVISQVEDLALSIFDRWKPAMLEGIKYMQDFLKSNREMLIGLTEGLKPALEILGVGGTLILGLKAVALITPVLAGAFSALSASVVTYATTNASAMTVLNTQLFGVSLSARAATGALGILGIAAGGLFAAFAGWEIGKYLYDQFEEARLIGLGFVDTLMRGFIEVEHGGRLAWAGLKTGFGVVMGEMLKIFASFVEGAATAFNALGGYDIGGPLQRASMLIKEAARDTGKLTTAFDEAAKARSSAISEHEKIIEAIRLEHGGYTKSAEESRKSAEATLADIRKKADASGIFTKAQIDEMDRLSEAEIIANEERTKAQEEFFKKSGMMSKEMYQSRLKELDAEVTRFRLAGADEIQIAKWKSEEINKLNKQYAGQTTKQLAADGKARDKALDAALKAEFGFLDEREKAIGKAYEKTIKEHEAMFKEIAKLESQQAKEFEKTLDDSQKAYENFIKDRLDIKELSAESQAEIDREYERIFEDVQAGNIESFDAAMTAILEGKELNIEALKENDALYSAFLREQEAVNKDIRLEFYSKSGQFSQEYYDSEVDRINKYTEKLRAAGVDAVDVEREKTAQMRELDIKKLESSNSFFDGIKAAMLENQKATNEWTQAGKEIYDTFVSETSKSFSTLINSVIKGDMEGLRTAWDSLWQGMLSKVVDIIAQIAAEWAAEKITTAALGAAEWIAGSFEEGVFNFQPPAGTPEAPGGGFLSVLHPGESVLPADLTQKFKEATGWEEAKATALDYFGIEPGNDPGFFDTVGDYSGAGKSLYDAWNAFREGDNTAGSIALANAFQEGFNTYAANAGSQSAANLAGGLGGFAGAVGSGIGAWQSFQNEDWAQGIIQSVQTLQQAASAYETLTASTINATSTASVTAAENAAASGAGSVASSLGQALEGGGWGSAIWSMFAMIAGDEHMQSSLASVGATAGATIGATIGSVVPGVGNIVGGAFGAAIGGLAGTVMDVAQGPGARFEVDDLNAPINAARTWTPDGWAGSLNPPEGDAGSAHANARNAYLQTTQASMDIATAAIASATQILGPELGAQFQSVFAANIDPVDAAGMNWQIGEEGRGANTAARLAGNYWNDTIDALRIAALAVAPELGGGYTDDGRFISNPMYGLAEWASANMVPQDFLIDPTGAAQAESDAAWQASLREQREREQMAGGGAATGGVVGIPKESGFLDVTTGEGILPVPALKWAEDIGKMIQSGGLFGGQFPEFDKEIPQNEITVTFPDDVGRSNVMTELYASDIVTNTTGANERLDRIIERLEMLVGINRDIASKPVPQITRDGLVGMVADPLQQGAQSGRYQFTDPLVVRAARTTLGNTASGWSGY